LNHHRVMKNLDFSGNGFQGILSISV
jgi:hypothetical protein